MCLLEGILGDKSRCKLKIFQFFSHSSIHADLHELEGSMLPCTVHFCITKHINDIQVGIIIVGLIMYIVICFNNEILDVVTLKGIQIPVV